MWRTWIESPNVELTEASSGALFRDGARQAGRLDLAQREVENTAAETSRPDGVPTIRTGRFTSIGLSTSSA